MAQRFFTKRGSVPSDRYSMAWLNSGIFLPEELGYQDSNLERQYQKLLCCQLHHTPMNRGVFKQSMKIEG